MTTASIGEDFARAVAAKDRDAFGRLLAADVDFKGLTPGRAWEATGPAAVAAVFFDSWFEPGDTIEALVDVTTGADVADTRHVSYRLDLVNDAGGPGGRAAGLLPHHRRPDQPPAGAVLGLPPRG